MSKLKQFKKLIFVFIILLLGLTSFSQENSLLPKYEDDNGTHIINVIDSITGIIDNKNSRLLNLKLFPDSVVGEKIVSVKKQHFKSLTKYTIQTKKTGNQMDTKYVILYVQKDNLLLAKVCYSMDVNMFFEKFYYNNSICYYSLLSDRGMRFSKEGKDIEFVKCLQKLLSYKNQ